MQKNEFLRLIEEAIESDPNTLTGEEVLAELDGWDSMSILGFLALVDERLGVAIQPKLLAECKTVDDLVGLVGDRVTA